MKPIDLIISWIKKLKVLNFQMGRKSINHPKQQNLSSEKLKIVRKENL